MKIKTYFHLPALLLAGTFLGTSSTANAGTGDSLQEMYNLCKKGIGNRQVCRLVRELYYENIKFDFLIPICDPRYCDPPEFFDNSKIDPGILRDKLVDIVDELDQEIINLDKFTR
jgi:hypothetical protein